MEDENNIYVRKDVYEAEKNTLQHDLSGTSQRISDLRDDVNRSLSGLGFLVCVIGFLFAGLQVGVALMLYVITRGI